VLTVLRHGVVISLAKATDNVRISMSMEVHRCLTELLLGRAQLVDPDQSVNRQTTLLKMLNSQ